jgi:hypothetical protein
MAGSGGYLNGTLAWSPDGTRLADAGQRGTSVWSLTDRSAPVFAVERDGTTADLAQALIDEGGCTPHPSVTPRRGPTRARRRTHLEAATTAVGHRAGQSNPR